MCEITVVSAELRSDAIFIEGTSDCQAVSVRLELPNTTGLTATVDDEGHWEVTFTASEVPNLDQVRCPDRVKVDLHCVEDPTCTGPADVNLVCAGAACPTLDLALTELGACDANDQRTATFAITVTNAPDPTILTIDYGDGSSEAILNSEVQGSGGAISKQHAYDPGSYTVVVTALFPEGCAGSNPVSVDIVCEIDCPSDVAFEIEAADGRRYRTVDGSTGPYEEVTDDGDGAQVDCLPAGSTTVVLVAPDAAGLGITWRQDDDPPQVTDQPTFDVTPADGAEVTVNVTLTQERCPPLSESVVVAACGCKPTDWSAWSACEACEQTRTRTLRDCTTETETRSCTMPPGPWTPWQRSWFCGSSRTRRGPDCTTETQSEIDGCCVWMWITLGLIAVTGILILITLCLLPATVLSAVAAAGSLGALIPIWAGLTAFVQGMVIASVVALLVSIVNLIVWLAVCVFANARDAACFLLGIFIQVMAWLTSISFIVALILWLIGALGCAIGATIDVAWFGAILGVAIIIQSFLCAEEA